MKKVAIYIRVSTQEQAKEGFSIAAQRDKLIAYCKAKSWNIYDIYIDDGYTGTNIDRPAINQLLDHLNAFDIVLVYKLDRLSRSQKDVLYLVEDKFLNNNVDFVSILESFDTSTPFGRAMLGILAVFAQLERETIIERTKLGKERRAKEGLWRGGGNIPIGYDFIDDQLIINEYDAMQVKEIFRLYSEGLGFNKIAVTLNKKGYKTTNNTKWSSSQVSRTLRNSTYVGLIEYNGEFYPGSHEPIIDKALFDKVADILSNNKNNKSNSKSKVNYLLKGMLWCGYCGTRIKGNWSSKGAGGPKYYHYVCYSKLKRPLHMVKDPNCPSKSWKMETLDGEVVEQLMQLPLNRDKIIQKYEENKQSIKTYEDKFLLEQQLSEIDKQINRLMDLYQDGKIPANKISERIDKLYQDKKKIERNLEELNSHIIEENNHDISLDEILELLGNFELIWAEATFEERRIILRDFIKKIIVTDKPKIEWNNKNLN
ncbi:site-specific DNA recombinase [Anaerosolibacter carboniphilus]|uniref:Site-specific DNA recombinase n=1 Tax=Anaerosolibacter carboniphilus TaxID=1417629 RepID=A0A841L1Q5_9FIRM|nr:recombinase family protein [Anaerosolibacter carboniphilus]MBB6218100.1 site-specific DNA recombinase [Anaerosolibacter carboniphilus]